MTSSGLLSASTHGLPATCEHGSGASVSGTVEGKHRDKSR